MYEQIPLAIAAFVLAAGLNYASGWIAERFTPMRLFLLFFIVMNLLWILI